MPTIGTWGAPRVLGRGAADPLAPALTVGPVAESARALREGLAGSNVLLVLLDAGRARQLGCYGYGRPTTPNLDRIAAEGVRFESVFTPAVYTLGAMSSVWTSQYPDRHHSEVSFSARLPKDRLTLAELLSAQGVHTAGFVANAVAGKLFGFDRGFSEFHEVFRTLGSRGDVFRQALPPCLLCQDACGTVRGKPAIAHNRICPLRNIGLERRGLDPVDLHRRVELEGNQSERTRCPHCALPIDVH